jgi:RNA-directed DNA polymerase
MKVTESGDLKHSQLLFEDYLQMVSAEQREHAEVCEPPKMTETDSTFYYLLGFSPNMSSPARYL